MRRQPEVYLKARLLGVFLMSLAALSGSLAAWTPAALRTPLGLLWPPLVLGAASFLGAAWHERLAVLLERTARERVLGLVTLLHTVVLLGVSVGLLAGQRDSVESGIGVLRGLQPAFLLLAGFGRGYRGVFVNGLALTASSMLAGGAGAAISASLFGGLTIFFLIADRMARTLTEFPVDGMPAPGPTLGRAALHALGVSGALAAFFAAQPPVAYAPLAAVAPSGPLEPDQLASLLANVLSVGLVAGAAFWLALRWGGGRAKDVELAQVRIVAAQRSTAPAEAGLPPEPVPDPGGPRARIVKFYVKLLETLARRGTRRRRWQTPAEFAQQLQPESASAELSALFVRARYGADEPAEADVEAAQRAGREILDQPPRRIV